MEPADIDWKRVVSRFVPDEALESINAPQWVDLTDPDASFHVDDDAWFCRPDCNHPKTFEEFQRLSTPSPPKGKVKIIRSSSEKLPFGDRNCANLRENNNLKKRVGINNLVPSSPFRSPSKSKKQLDDTENQDPNLPRPTAAPKGGKNWKDPVKCSAAGKNKNPEEEREELLCEQEKIRQPPLRSTLSARNLFSGRDILSQITEFCNEIKRFAVGAKEVSLVEEENSKEGFHEKRSIVESPSSKFPSGSEKKKRDVKTDLCIETVKERGGKGILSEKTGAVLREVRASPPTPQRFPSPSSQRLKNTKLTSTMSCKTAMGSPLKNQTKSTPERRILRDIMKQSTEDQKLLISKEENSTHSGGNPTSLFWFMKPCTYLVE